MWQNLPTGIHISTTWYHTHRFVCYLPLRTKEVLKNRLYCSQEQDRRWQWALMPVESFYVQYNTVTCVSLADIPL